MIYTLRHFDTLLIRFSAESGAEPNVKILWVDEERKKTPAPRFGRSFWKRYRKLGAAPPDPKNRAYVDSVLSAMGLSINRPFDILRVSKGLSLNDCYWVTEGGFDGTFEKYNLYDNRFNRTLGQIAFTGYGSNPSRLTSSPELTTNGMLRKCWRRENGSSVSIRAAPRVRPMRAMNRIRSTMPRK